jgi:hypothetical protein
VFSKDTYEGIPDNVLQSELVHSLPVRDLGCLLVREPLPTRDNIQVLDVRAVFVRGASDFWAIDIADFVLVGAEEASQLETDAQHIEQFPNGLEAGMLSRPWARVGVAGGFGACVSGSRYLREESGWP